MQGTVLPALLVMIALHAITAQAGNEPAGELKKVDANSAIAAKPSNKLPAKLIYPGDAFYPDAIAKNGVQGEVKLFLVVSDAAKLLSVKIVGSSDSAELDQNALDYVRSDNWKLPEINAKAPEKNYTLSVVFLRDSVLTINTKTCADFNADLGYFRAIRPADDVADLGALEMIASLYTVQLMKTRDAAETFKYVNAIPAINEQTIKACAEKPDALLLQSYVEASREFKISF